MKKKFRSSKGFTLAEVLVAVAILAIFVSMAAVGTTSLFGTGEKMMGASKAAVLGSDVMQVITNEIRFGEKFTLGEGASEAGTAPTIKYNSTTYGDDSELTLDKDGQLIVKQGSSKTFTPIGSAAYDEVRIKSMSFGVEYVSDEENKPTSNEKIITVTVSITSDGTNTLWSNTVKITPLYQKVKS